METWQRCPICEGRGTTGEYISAEGCVPCPVCKGKRIINTITGLPPGDLPISSPVTTGDPCGTAVPYVYRYTTTSNIC
jgi:hypothetical protein